MLLKFVPSNSVGTPIIGDSPIEELAARAPGHQRRADTLVDEPADVLLVVAYEPMTVRNVSSQVLDHDPARSWSIHTR